MISNIFSKSGIKICASLFFLVSFTFEVDFAIHRFIYAVSLAALLNLLRVLDQRFALPELIGFVTVLMFMTAPALMFDIGSREFLHPNSFSYDIIAVPPVTYYSFAIPAVLFFYFFITNSFKKYRTKDHVISVFDRIKNRYDISKVIILFALISFTSSLLLNSIAALNQIFYLGSQLLTVILVLSLLLKSDKRKKIIFVFVIGLMLLNTLRSGMFSEIVFSLLFYALFWVLINGLSNRLKIILPALGIFLLVLLQVFKNDYRDETWSASQNNSNFNVAVDVAQNINQDLSLDFFKMSSTFTLVRLNMGLLSSRVIKHVPQSEDYAYGETIVSAVLSLIPRVLWPSKPELSGPALMIKYGNYTPRGDTSMSITQLGESYANFGYFGGILFYGLYGVFVAFTLSFLIRKSIKGRPFILFVPIVMYHMTKPEVIFSKAFNTAFKGVIFFIIIMFLVNNFCINQSNDK